MRSSLLKNKSSRFAATLAVSFLAIVFFSQIIFAQTANLPAQIPLQGKLSDSSGKALTGNFNFKFEIFDSPTAGAKLWEEEQKGIPVSRGKYQVYLGKVSPLTESLAKDNLLYIQVYVKTVDEPAYKTLSPRLALSPSFAKVPLAKKADTADSAASANSLVGGLDARKLSGQINNSQISDLDAGKILSGIIDAVRIPSLDAGKITAGKLDAARGPTLDAGKISAGIFDSARIPSLDAGKIISGIFDIARIPSLDAGKITTGIFDAARIPSLDKISGQVTNLQLPSIDSSKIPDLSAGKITSGTFAWDRMPVKVSAGKTTTSDNQPISFSSKDFGVSSFVTAPRVTCSTEDAAFFCSVQTVSATQFIVRIKRSTDSVSGSNIPINWIAIGS